MRRLTIGATLAALCVGCGADAPPATTAAAPAQDFTESAVNRAPIIESVRIEPSEPAQGAVVRAVVTARDPDGEGVVLAYHWFLDGAEQGAGDATFALDQAGKGAQIRVSVTASDGALASDAMDASARVIDRTPSLTSVILVPGGTIAPGQTLNARAGAMDPDGDPVDYEYTWYVNGAREDGQGALFATDKLKHGDSIYAEVRATDGSNWTDPQRTPVVTVGNAHPEITSTPPGLRDDGEFRYKVEAVDPDGDRRLRYALEKGPDGMVIDDITGALVWHPRSDQVGVHPVVVVVRDSGGLETKQSFSVTMQEKVETVAAPEGRHIRIREPKPAVPASPGE